MYPKKNLQKLLETYFYDSYCCQRACVAEAQRQRVFCYTDTLADETIPVACFL